MAPTALSGFALELKMDLKLSSTQHMNDSRIDRDQHRFSNVWLMEYLVKYE